MNTIFKQWLRKHSRGALALVVACAVSAGGVMAHADDVDPVVAADSVDAAFDTMLFSFVTEGSGLGLYESVETVCLRAEGNAGDNATLKCRESYGPTARASQVGACIRTEVHGCFGEWWCHPGVGYCGVQCSFVCVEGSTIHDDLRKPTPTPQPKPEAQP